MPRVAQRPATADEPLLRELHSGTLPPGLADVPGLAAQQYDARRRDHAASFPGADRRIVLVDGWPAGLLCVHRTPQAWRVVDIALLPEVRGRGVGATLLAGLVAEATRRGVPVVLTVGRDATRARRLYERLGFAATGGDELHVAMRHPPSPPRS